MPAIAFAERTGGVCAIELGEGLSDPAGLTMTLVYIFGFVVMAVLMSVVVGSIARYEATARREQVLAAKGLDLVAATDMTSIAVAAVESALALCGSLRGVRVAMAVLEDPERRPLRFHVLDAKGECAAEMEDGWLDGSAIVPAGHDIPDQRLTEAHRPADDASTSQTPEQPFLPSEVLLTRVGADGGPRGVLTVESPELIRERAAKGPAANAA